MLSVDPFLKPKYTYSGIIADHISVGTMLQACPQLPMESMDAMNYQSLAPHVSVTHVYLRTYIRTHALHISGTSHSTAADSYSFSTVTLPSLPFCPLSSFPLPSLTLPPLPPHTLQCLTSSSPTSPPQAGALWVKLVTQHKAESEANQWQAVSHSTTCMACCIHTI